MNKDEPTIEKESEKEIEREIEKEIEKETEKESDEVKLDFSREHRTGLSEAIFCPGKQKEQLVYICEQLQKTHSAMLFTRMSSGQYDDLNSIFPKLLDYDAVSRTAQVLPKNLGLEVDIAIVSGGSSDTPIAREVEKTLAFYGVASLVINDIGVAGLWRLMERIDEIKTKKVVICIAGMDAALPTVLGGLIPSSLIAVPSSVGYGMAKKGETALHALLVSCAPGIVVVNIDNGYGAACAAIRILNQLK